MRHRLGIVLPFVVAATFLLAGCGDDPDDEGDPGPAGQTSEPTESSSEPTADPSDSPPPSSPTVEPATGDVLELSNVSARAPKGFKADPPDMSYLRFAFEGSGQAIALANTPSVNDALSLREQARISIRSHVYSQPPKILEPVEIGGVTMYHYAGRVDESEYAEEYGAIYDGSQVSINFLLSADTPAAERQEIVDSVMASFTFS